MDKNRLERLLDKLNETVISDQLRQDTLSDSLQRALILAGVLAISAISAFFLTISLGAFYLSNGEPLFLLATAFAALTMAGYMGTLWFFKRQQTLLPAANLYALTTTFSTVAPCVLTGGVTTSSYLSMILVMPIFLFLMAGRKHGVYWSLIAVLCVATLFILESSGVSFPQMVPDSKMAFFSFMTWLMTLSLLV